jgi:hypothetical protein
MRWGRWLICCLAFTSGCAPVHVVSVLSPHERRHEDALTSPLTVVIDSASVRLPVAVSGASVAYADVDRVLEDAVFSAVLPAIARRGGDQRFELFVEIVEVRAEYSGGRLVFELTTRATLRDRNGNAYVAQTHARSRTSRTVPPEGAASEVRTAAETIGNELAGWILGLDVRATLG